MKTFTDNAGRTWSLAIHVDAIKRVRGTLDVDLMSAVDGKLLERLVADPVLLCDVLFVLVQPEAEAHNISAADFGRALGGDAIDQATKALLEELVAFFPLGKRRLLQTALDKYRALEQRALEVAEQRLASPELAAELERHLQTLGSWSGSSPASSASTPDP